MNSSSDKKYKYELTSRSVFSRVVQLVLKLVASFFSHCLAYELNLTRRLFKGRVVHSVQLQMQIENIIFKSWGMHRKHEMVLLF